LRTVVLREDCEIATLREASLRSSTLRRNDISEFW
jgi:hypothetical protein